MGRDVLDALGALGGFGVGVELLAGGLGGEKGALGGVRAAQAGGGVGAAPVDLGMVAGGEMDLHQAEAVEPLLVGADDLGGEDGLGGIDGAKGGELGDDGVVAPLAILGVLGRRGERFAEHFEHGVVGVGGEGEGDVGGCEEECHGGGYGVSVINFQG